jgi:hypothetical protein
MKSSNLFAGRGTLFLRVWETNPKAGSSNLSGSPSIHLAITCCQLLHKITGAGLVFGRPVENKHPRLLNEYLPGRHAFSRQTFSRQPCVSVHDNYIQARKSLALAVVVDQTKRLAKSMLRNPGKSLNVRIAQDLLVARGQSQDRPQ